MIMLAHEKQVKVGRAIFKTLGVGKLISTNLETNLGFVRIHVTIKTHNQVNRQREARNIP